MILTLRLRNASTLPPGAPGEFVLDRRGAIIGRSPSCDWSLPDPRSYVSSRHCEVRWEEGGYVLTDTSTNGTFLNGARQRMAGPRRIAQGDTFVVGPFEIVATLGEAAARSDVGATSAGWGAPPGMSAPADPAWATPHTSVQPATGWPGAAPDAAARPAGDDVWGRIADGNAVDWARGGFGSAAMLPPTVASAAPAAADSATARFAAAAGLQPGQLRSADGETLARAGRLFGRLVAGLMVMVEARARAKSQLGAEATSLSFDGNNPLKFARAPEQAIAQLLNPPERGFMAADRAIEDAFQELQAHQVATLKAMQGALRATLDRFSPGAIRKRAESKGLLARILPGAREAALWQAYEREFGGVAQGSDEAFMDVFAKEFRRAYEEQARGPGR